MSLFHFNRYRFIADKILAGQLKKNNHAHTQPPHRFVDRNAIVNRNNNGIAVWFGEIYVELHSIPLHMAV